MGFRSISPTDSDFMSYMALSIEYFTIYWMTQEVLVVLIQ